MRKHVHIKCFPTTLPHYKYIPTEHVRCNPDVAPRLTSSGYEEKVDVIIKQNIVRRGWRMLIPYEDNVDVIIYPNQILFTGGGKFWALMKIKLMLLPQPTNCSQGVANFDPSWRYWWYYPIQHIVQTGWRILIPHEYIVGVMTPTNKLFRGGGEFWPLMKIKLMLLPQSTLFKGRGDY